MIFDAWLDLIADDRVAAQPSAMRVYSHLYRQHNPAIFFKPVVVRSFAVAAQLHLKPQTVIRALDLLAQRGYLLELGRGHNNTRRFLMALTLHTSEPVVPSNGTLHHAVPNGHGL